MRKFLSRNRGVVTVEVALGVIILIFATVMILEMAYRIYLVNLVEFALRESVRATTVHQGGNTYTGYNNRFNNVMNEPGTLWEFLTPLTNFSMSGKYYQSYADLVGDTSFTDAEMLVDDSGYAFAEVSLSYQYQPILSLLGTETTTVTRTTLVSLEHEGWEEN
ncbi:TadE/TadG family type IV pilus assembly protein [Vibrio agarivorans]|uniref:Pilus assembly protein n=1 Tax=Vibrio agarivorans TaxID=153622 RepID=A0ABT7XXB3_9VIBR|nr:pilus assembly protein [Vibrio agarivorans]MDN2480406.1 pilus assembly protein [Vibrio agarivorans]